MRKNLFDGDVDDAVVVVGDFLVCMHISIFLCCFASFVIR